MSNQEKSSQNTTGCCGPNTGSFDCGTMMQSVKGGAARQSTGNSCCDCSTMMQQMQNMCCNNTDPAPKA